jgi:hypothetical protein
MKWEYRTIRLTAEVSSYRDKKMEDALDSLEPLLCEAGNEGWELVTTFDTEVLGYTKFIVGIFKRPKI